MCWKRPPARKRKGGIRRPLGPPMVLWAWFARRPGFYAFASRWGIRVLRLISDRRGMVHTLPFARGWTDGRFMPAPARETFRDWYARRQEPGGAGGLQRGVGES